MPFAVTSWPATGVETWPLSKIKPYPQNPRTHPDSQVDLLAEHMKRWGVDQPIVVDENGVILKGHGRLLAAIKAGFREFPVAQHLGLTDEEKRALRIADNQIGLLSGWDENLVLQELRELKLAEFDMPLLGFSPTELNDLMALGTSPPPSLAERFGIVPFSVLSARDGIWQDRKRAWLALGIQSELGRGENLLQFSDSVALDGTTYKRRAEKKSGQKR